MPPHSFADTQAALAVQAKLQGALMRTILLVNSDLDNYCSNPSQFYVNPPINMYAKLWHQAGINGKAYGFGFDDTCDQSSFKLVFNPTKLTIRLQGNRP
jgi:Beta-1,3-glucanase